MKKLTWPPEDCVYERVNHRNPSHASTVKIVQRSGIILKRAIQIVIKSEPKVIIKACSQKNWEQRGKCLRNILLTNKEHLACNWLHRTIYYVPLDRQWICPLMSTLTGSSRIKRLGILDNCRMKLCAINTFSLLSLLFFLSCHATVKVLWSL